MKNKLTRVIPFLCLMFTLTRVLAADKARVIQVVKADTYRVAVARLQYAEIEFAYRMLDIRAGDIIDVNFGCRATDPKTCASISPSPLIVNGTIVNFLNWDFLNHVGKACVHHGPVSSVHGKFDDSYPRGLIADVRIGEGTLFMTLLFDGVVAPSELADLKRKDSVEIIFPLENPNVAIIRGVEIKIEHRSFQDEAFNLCQK